MTMTRAPHPTPAAVRPWFAGDDDGDIDGRALVAALRTLRTDPDWRVQATPGPALWDIALIHWPTHTRLAVRLAPVAGSGGALWRPTPDGRPARGRSGDDGLPRVSGA